MATSADTCSECNKLHDVKCNICDKVCGTKKRECDKHRTMWMICGDIGITCDECKSKELEFVSGYGGSPYIKKGNATYWLDDLKLRPYIRNFDS